MQNEARKKKITSLFNDQIKSNRQNSYMQYKNWGLLVYAPLLHSFEEKSFFTEFGLGTPVE